MGGVINGPANAAKIEKDWQSVFDFFPGSRARFIEIVNLDAREVELNQERKSNPQVFAIWLQLYDRVTIMWNEFRDDMTKKLTFLGTPRRIQIVLRGRIDDEDPAPFDDDEFLDFSEPITGTIRFGEMWPVSYQPAADEVRIHLNLQCRLVVGPADTVQLEVIGPVDIYESGDHEGSININERLDSGQTSRVHNIASKYDPDDKARVSVRFDLLP